jgi:hypothetical protein
MCKPNKRMAPQVGLEPTTLRLTAGDRAALDTAALMLGSDKSRGYCLEMICADFLAGAHVESGNPKVLLFSMLRLFRFLPEAQKQEFLCEVTQTAGYG